MIVNLRVAYLWSIHDYLAYGKFVGWCVYGRLNCPVCMDDSDAFKLQHGRKVSFFDYHQRFLPLSHKFRGDKELFQKGKSINDLRFLQRNAFGNQNESMKNNKGMNDIMHMSLKQILMLTTFDKYNILLLYDNNHYIYIS
jgi:hypothetical protein